MSDAIDIDPVDLEELLGKAIANLQGNLKTQYDAMTDIQKAGLRDLYRAQMRETYRMAEEVRQETIDDVLRIFDVVAPSNNTKLIRDAIVRFKLEA